MNHRVVRFQSGSPGAASLENLALGQAMHSALGPWQEAQSVYVQQARLRERLAAPRSEPCVVYDVGMGIAANALAILAEAAQSPRARDLHLVSFENDVSGLRLALEHVESFAFLKGHEEKLRSLLEKGQWREPGLTWALLQGDIGETLSQAPGDAELMLYDFYSPAAQPRLWTLNLFERLRAKGSTRGGRWISYSSATAVKVALVLAGFRVAKGVGTPLKRETTLAAWGDESLPEAWGAPQFDHILRSTKRWPADVVEAIRSGSVSEQQWLARVKADLTRS